MSNREEIGQYLEEFEKLIGYNIQQNTNEEYSIEAQENIEYIPEGQRKDCPEYKPTTITYTPGPKAITIEQYLQSRNIETKPHIHKRRKSRAGKKHKQSQHINELHRLIHISKGKEKHRIIQELIAYKKLISK